MVFYVPPKRLLRKRTTQEKASVRDLPDEILLQIFQDLDFSSILRCRRSCSHCVPACNTIIQTRSTTLYLHPASKHLQAAIEICGHPIFSQEIDEVVVLGSPMWRDIEKVFKNYRRYAFWKDDPDDPKGDSASYHDSLKYIAEKGWEAPFRIWPLEYPKSNTKSQKAGSQVDDSESLDIPAFVIAYDTLIDALASLPKLRKLTYGESVARPGFNEVSQAVMQRHRKPIAAAPKPSSKRAMLSCPRTAKPKAVGFADSDIFYCLLFSPRLRFDAVRQEREVPFVGEAMVKLCPHTELAAQHPRFTCTFSSLDFSLDCGWPYNDCHTLYRRLLKLASQSLQRLRLAFIPNASMKKAGVETTAEMIIGGIEFPRLQSLQLALLDPKAPSGKSPEDPSHPPRRQRPICQDFDIETFLSSHTQTLIHVECRDVFFTNSEEQHRQGATIVLRSTLQYLKMSKDLQQFEWVLGRYRHDRRCKRSDTDFMFECTKYDCGRYNNEPWHTSNVDEFERLTVELNADYKEEEQVWDFGQHVMRALGQEVVVED